MVEINEDVFARNVVSSYEPSVLYFSASWCKPCKTYNSVVEELEDKLDGVNVYKINVEKNLEIAEYYNVSGLPTVMVVSNKGSEVERWVGTLNAEALEARVRESLNGQ